MALSKRSTGQRPVSLSLTTLEDRTTPTTHAGYYPAAIPGADTQYVSSISGPLQTANRVAAPIAVLVNRGTDVTSPNDDQVFLVTGSMPGQPANVTIRTLTGNTIYSFDPFGGGFTGGVRVATGDVSGDGTDDLVITAGNGGGPRVQVRDGHSFTVYSDSYFIEDTFRGGYYVGVGDVNNDGKADVLGMAGEGGGPRVTIMSGAAILSNSHTVLANFYAYESGLRDGGMICSADVNGDGWAEVITAPGFGGGPRVRVIDGYTLMTSGSIQTHADFFAADPNGRFGVNISVGQLDEPCGANVIVATPRPNDPDQWVRVINPIGGKQLASAGFHQPPMKGAFSAILPAYGNNKPEVLVSGWFATGDAVLSYPVEGYDRDAWDCAPIVVDPPSPPPPPPPAPSSDLHLVKIADRTTAQTGDTVTFTLTVRNDGPNSATSVLVNDPLTAGFVYLGSSASVGAYNASTGRWTLGDLANGATGALTITARVTSVGSLTNTATASSSVGDPDPADNTSFVVITGTSPPPPPPAASANLRITKQASDTTVSIGETETYTVTVSNVGPDAATSVTVSDQLPSGFSFLSSNASAGAYNATTGTWTLGSLANGASATLTINGTIASTGNITNTASVTSAVGDPDTADNTASTSINSYTLTQLSANGLFYPVNNPGSGVPIADISVGVGPVTLSRMVITLGTGLWSNLNTSSLQLKVQGALPSDPRLGTTYQVDATGTILTIDGIAFDITTSSEIFRLTADVGGTAVPLQVTSVRAYGHP